MSILGATGFEFRHRYWFIFGIFWLSFGLYNVDPVNAAAALAGLAADPRSNAFRWELRALFLVGALLTAAGAGLRTWGTAYLRPEVMRDHRLHAERLTADGPFRHVRNPLYLGNILMAAGMGLSASRMGAATLVALMTLFGCRLILREEAALEAAQGEDYAAYRAAVPRLLPALRPRVPASGNEPAWGPAFLAEAMIWFFALALGALAVTLSEHLFWILLAAGIVGSILLHPKGARLLRIS